MVQQRHSGIIRENEARKASHAVLIHKIAIAFGVAVQLLEINFTAHLGNNLVPYRIKPFAVPSPIGGEVQNLQFTVELR